MPQGSGEPLRQLIKDLSYRNSQERELGNLEVARRRLDLLERELEFAVRYEVITRARAVEIARAVLVGAPVSEALNELLQLPGGGSTG